MNNQNRSSYLSKRLQRITGLHRVLLLTGICSLSGCATFDQMIGYEPYPPCESCGSPIAQNYPHQANATPSLPADPYNDVHHPSHPQTSSDDVYASSNPHQVAQNADSKDPFPPAVPGVPQQPTVNDSATANDDAAAGVDLSQVRSEIADLKTLITQATTDRDVLERRVTSLNSVVKGIQQENRMLQQQLEDIEEKATLQHQVEMEKLLAIQRFVDRLEQSRTSTASVSRPAFQ